MTENQKITFSLESEQLVVIKRGEQTIGHIFTPCGTNGDELNVVQVCGFDELFDYWGCGVYAEEEMFSRHLPLDQSMSMIRHGVRTTGVVRVEKHTQKKDVRMLFKENEKTIVVNKMASINIQKDCLRCYNVPCTCDNKEGPNPYSLKREEDIREHITKVPRGNEL